MHSTSNHEPYQPSLDDSNELKQDHPDKQNLEEALHIAKGLCDQVKNTSFFKSKMNPSFIKSAKGMQLFYTRLIIHLIGK